MTIKPLESLESLTAEDSKGSRIQIPMSLYEKIIAFQKAYKLKFNRKISREHVMLKMMSFGTEQLESVAAEYRADAVAQISATK